MVLMQEAADISHGGHWASTPPLQLLRRQGYPSYAPDRCSHIWIDSRLKGFWSLIVLIGLGRL